MDTRRLVLIAWLALGGVAEAQSAEVLDGSGVQLKLTFPARPGGLSHAALREWVRRSARIVGAYFGSFPVRTLTLEITQEGPGHVRNGTAYGGRYIVVHLGDATTEADLRDDWVLVHEMFHTGFPAMDDAHHWMEEGLSTYLEPLARARAGELTPDRYWTELVHGLPQGEPGPGDQGLSHTSSWANTYWGGCHFWLLADLRIRHETHEASSLAEGLRAVLAQGGDATQDWSAARVFQVLDAATHTHVLTRLNEELAERSAPLALPALWKLLGVSLDESGLHFDDHAEWAPERRALLRR